ncbi:high-affinity Zn(2+) transporter zrt1 [Exophiala xenobiotica]|uniref:High-affinity Zn(2+) transporter zrt1 n=1 Tax=Lithohypha guttulata TaxID=1690604 RepID=A0ABR0JW63_9EURO|nr:high-affinity Zn(2+) transporter zrt1 [Lithohypha guttulata]KAK5309854.1 high-affinity Zn(2+) transporter zrt1 [Exophiala xenobiotica]
MEAECKDDSRSAPLRTADSGFTDAKIKVRTLESFCVDPEGNDVLVLTTTESGHDDAEEEGHTDEASKGGLDCHFHAGVEHCVAAGASESSTETAASCDAPPNRDYNVGLRVGSIFVILTTSSLAVFSPLFLHKLPFGRINGTIFTIIKQFGTGIIISTAFVHLYTHAYLMFTSNCLTGINYEATTSAVVMAGLFSAFLVEYFGYRFIVSKQQKTGHLHHTTGASGGSEEGSTIGADAKYSHGNVASSSALQDISHSHAPADFNPNTPLAVGVMEAGILFHSILIGITLVVAPDSSGNTSGYYNTLLAVIVFHQFFEGLALGARIALLANSAMRFGIWGKILMAAAFALITPLGMAIGVGVLDQFNGNDQSTILTIGVLDALSAGVLLWVGVVDMWARDWAVTGGEMVQADIGKVTVGLCSLIVGMGLMSLLGKWA